METWAIKYNNPNEYILRGDNTEQTFKDYNSLVQFAKSLPGNNKFFDLSTDGIIETYYGIVTKLDSQYGQHDGWLMNMWNTEH